MSDDKRITGMLTAAPSPIDGDEDLGDTLSHSKVMMIDDDPITLEVIQAF